MKKNYKYELIFLSMRLEWKYYNLFLLENRDRVQISLFNQMKALSNSEKKIIIWDKTKKT